MEHTPRVDPGGTAAIPPGPHVHDREDFWKNYMVGWFGTDLIARWEEYCTETFIRSNDDDLHLEVYDSGEPEKPTLIFAHGIAGYARVLLPFIIPLREKGYNIIAPDLQGFGYSKSRKGDFEWNVHLRNLADTVAYAKTRFSGKIILGGASMGGPLAYATAARYGDVDALVCWCLWDLSDREFLENETTTRKATFVLIPFLKLASILLGSFRFKTHWVVSYDTLSDSREFNDLVKQDPQAGTLLSVRGALSLVLQSKPDAVPEHWDVPVLVVHPGEDKMIPKKYSVKTFEKLSSREKKYVEFEGVGHFPLDQKTYSRWSTEVDDFMRAL